MYVGARREMMDGIPKMWMGGLHSTRGYYSNVYREAKQ